MPGRAVEGASNKWMPVSEQRQDAGAPESRPAAFGPGDGGTSLWRVCETMGLVSEEVSPPPDVWIRFGREGIPPCEQGGWMNATGCDGTLLRDRN